MFTFIPTIRPLLKRSYKALCPKCGEYTYSFIKEKREILCKACKIKDIKIKK